MISNQSIRYEISTETPFFSFSFYDMGLFIPLNNGGEN